MITFKSLILSSGSDVVADWYVSHPWEKKRWQNLWVRYFTMMRHLAAQPIGGWSENYFHKFKGYEGLGRIGFDYKGIAYRHVGFYGPGQDEFTILCTAEEHSDVYLPKGCIEDSFGPMNLVKQNRLRVRNANIRVPPEDV